MLYYNVLLSQYFVMFCCTFSKFLFCSLCLNVYCLHLPTKVNDWFVTTYLAIKHNSDSELLLKVSSFFMFLVFLEGLGWLRGSSMAVCQALCDIACKNVYTNQFDLNLMISCPMQTDLTHFSVFTSASQGSRDWMVLKQ